MTQEAFFGFITRPFQASPQQESFVPLEPMAEAAELLSEAAIKGDGIGVLTAAPGAGKTTVCLQLQSRLEPEFATVLLSDCSFPTRRSLLQSILHSLGVEYAGLAEQELRLRLLDAVQALREDHTGLVLIADEAHQLGPRLLEELRCLTNHVDRGQPLIRVLLSGQLSLEEQLIKPELQSLNYRITCHVSLEPLSIRESARYIDERLSRSGGDAGSLFSEKALEMICRISDGNPRALNKLADACLTHAAETGEFTIGVSMVRLVLQELKQLPIQWNESACDQLADDDRLGRASSEIDDCCGDNDAEFEDSFAETDSHEGYCEDTVDETPSAGEPAWSSHVVSFEIGAAAERTNEPVEGNEAVGEDEQSTAARGIDEIELADSECARTESDSSIPISSEAHWSRTSDRAKVSAQESTDIDEHSAPLTISIQPPSDRTSATAGELQEILVHDRYAALDRDTMGRERESIPAAIDWKNNPSMAMPQEHAAADSLDTSQSSEDDPEALPSAHEELLEAMSEEAPEERLNRVIQAVSDAVAQEMAEKQSRSHLAEAEGSEEPTYRLQLQTSPWRATPDPADFDMIEPEVESAAEMGSQVLSILQDVSEISPPLSDDAATASPDETASQDDEVADAIEISEERVIHADVPEPAIERPYARLFSRARRARSRT